jgi:hypothetical protein
MDCNGNNILKARNILTAHNHAAMAVQNSALVLNEETMTYTYTDGSGETTIIDFNEQFAELGVYKLYFKGKIEREEVCPLIDKIESNDPEVKALGIAMIKKLEDG